MSFARAVRSALHVDPYGNLFTERTRERLGKLLSPRWLKSKALLTLYEARHPDHPWITRDAIELIERYLQPRHQAFEWGSGNGTAWLARRCARLTSVEHDAGWGAKVLRRLEAQAVKNVDYRFVTEKDYEQPIAEIADGSLDLVLVDGLFRDRAVELSLPKLRPGAWLVLDNANWCLRSRSRTPGSLPLDQPPASPQWNLLERRLQPLLWRWTTNGVNDTAIFAMR